MPNQHPLRNDLIGRHNPIIYSAGKVWHNRKFEMMRDQYHYNIPTDWIKWGDDVKGDPRIWLHCAKDAAQCDLLILYCEDQNEDQRGAIVEAGIAMGNNKPVYCIGSCKTIKPNATSDVAFTLHPLWHWTTATTIVAGYREACFHWIRHYAPPLFGLDNVEILPIASHG